MHRILLLLLAACLSTFAQSASTKAPDEVLLNRAMMAIAEGKFDVANLTLHILVDSYPASEHYAAAVELLKDARVASCDGTSGSPSECDLADRSDSNNWHTTWVEEALRSAESVKVGMTRADVLRVFTTEGGLSSPAWRTYVYRKCRYIKVDVKFSTSGHEEHENDRIISISQPYLAWSVAD
jgi:hypothetical protein